MLVLINEVRKRSILWDKANPNYNKDKIQADNEWKKVAKKCGILKFEAKKKWRNLRDQFVKELKKIPPHRGKWQYFESLLFLRDTITIKDTEVNISLKPELTANEKKYIPTLYRDTPIIPVLINEVRKRNFLWDKTNIRYKDKRAADIQWNQIAKICGLLKVETKKKWRSLRDQFLKESKRIPTEASDSYEECVANYHGKWQHFESLLFLRVTVSPKDTEENISPKHEIALLEELMEFPPSEIDYVSESSRTENPTYSSSTTSHRSKKTRISKNEKLHEFSEIEENESFLFLKSLLPYFEKLDAIQQLRVRSKFQNILIEEIQINLTNNKDCQ